jgi:hypothetical protein
MKSSKSKIFTFFLGGFFLAGLLYSGIYIYLRTDDWIDHDAKSKFVNYSTGYIYDGHQVELKRQYRECFKFESIEGLTLPGRLIEKTYWEIKNPKGSHFPKEWKLPDPDKDWSKVLNIGKSRSETAYSELQKISNTNKNFPSGKLAAIMLDLWDPHLRTFLLSEPIAVIELPLYGTQGIGIHDIDVLVKKDGTVGKAAVSRNGKQETVEIIQHTLYCPAKNIEDYSESNFKRMRIVCGF